MPFPTEPIDGIPRTPDPLEASGSDSNGNEDDLLRSVALQNARSIQRARQREQDELVRAKDALEARTGELAHSLAMMRATLEATSDGIMASDNERRVTSFNQQYVVMWGLSNAGLQSPRYRHPGEICSKQVVDPEGFLARLDEIHDSAPAESLDVLEFLDGRVFERISRIQYVHGRSVGRVWSYRDITARRDIEQELRQVARSKDEFLALLAHELRNPLAPLRNGLQVMRLAAADAKAVAQARGMMERQLGHMVRLVDDLLDVSRIGQNKMELRKARISLSEIVESAVETTRPMIESAGHELSIAMPETPVHLEADLTRLAQVLSNLLTNSAKYTPRNGRIWLTATQQATGATITVRDNGIGIPAKELSRVFDLFSQVDRTIERTTGGLGIGLALVKGLVEMHGGTVVAQSEGHGKGSTFTIALPTVPAVADPRPASIHVDIATARTGRRILVVDDNEDAGHSLLRILVLQGNDVRIAHDGIAAVHVAREFQPEVILMDVGMPRMNGYEAVRRIRDQQGENPPLVIAVTGWGRDGDRIQSKEAGCDGHLVKPIDLSELNTLLNELAEANKQRSHIPMAPDQAKS